MRSYVHTCTQPSTSSSEHRSDSHTALTHLGQGKVASCFLSVGWRVGWSEGGGRGWEEGGGDWRGGGGGEGGGTSWLSVLTLSRDRGGGQGGKDRGIMRGEGGGMFRKGESKKEKRSATINEENWSFTEHPSFLMQHSTSTSSRPHTPPRSTMLLLWQPKQGVVPRKQVSG